MKFRTILAAFAIMASGSLCAQNATKADLDKLANQVNALSQKVTELEANLERVITENVNLVEQLNIKTVTSCTDKNKIKWDIVKVSPGEGVVTLDIRVTNNSGTIVDASPFRGLAVNSDSNLSNNSYEIKIKQGRAPLDKLAVGVPVNFSVEIVGVPTNSSYLSYVELLYSLDYGMTTSTVKFTGVHIPW